MNNDVAKIIVAPLFMKIRFYCKEVFKFILCNKLNLKIMKKMYSAGALTLIVLALSLNSCKKKGCISEEAKNYDTEAQKDDGTCEFYTNTEFITMSAWKYSSLSSTIDSLESQYDPFFVGSTFTFKTDGTVDFDFPAEPSASETKTWEFTADESQVILEKGLDKEDYMDISSLDIDNLSLKFDDEDSGAVITVNWTH